MAKIVPVSLGDVVRMKKNHPCGANEWEVIKVGMDIGLKCLGCSHKVRLLRSRFNSKFKGYVRRSSEGSQGS